MLRRFLLPLFGFALLATEGASAQTAPAVAKPAASAYGRPVARAGRTLTAREKRAAEAAAKAAAAAQPAVAPADATASANAWSGWSDAPVSDAIEVGNGQHRPTMNVSVAPGMPLNQMGHGVTTDYHGRPLRREVASTTITTAR